MSHRRCRPGWSGLIRGRAEADLALCLRRSPPQDDALADAQLRSMARHWARNLTRPVPVPVAARW